MLAAWRDDSGRLGESGRAGQNRHLRMGEYLKRAKDGEHQTVMMGWMAITGIRITSSPPCSAAPPLTRLQLLKMVLQTV